MRFETLKWDALVWWIVSNSIGIAIGFAISLAIGVAVSRLYDGLAEDQVPILTIMGMSVAILQGVVMHKYLGNGGWWAILTAVTWMAGQALTSDATLRLNGDGAHPEVIAGLVCVVRGSLLGSVQWLILRPRIRQAGLWIIASATGWLLMGLVVGKSIDNFVDIAAFGALPALVTGVALAWLLRESAWRRCATGW